MFKRIKEFLVSIERKILRFKREKDVLFVVRDNIMMTHAFDAYECLKDDKRLRLWFCFVTPGEFVNLENIKRGFSLKAVPPWLARKIRWDLIIYPNHEFYFRWSSPKIYIGHGLQSGKMVGSDDYVFGYRSKDWAGNILYQKIFRSSEFVKEGVKKHYPEFYPRVRVVGSILADRILRDSGNVKSKLQKLGLDPDKRTIFVASTWDQRSLIQNQGEELARQLPVLSSRYNIIISAHANNFKTQYGEKINWNDFCEGTNLKHVYVIKREQESHRFLPLADLLVMDMTSLGFYFTVLQRPVIYFEHPGIQYTLGALALELKKAAYVVRDLSSLNEDVEKAFASFDKNAMEEFSNKTFSFKGAAQERYRQEICESLGLTVEPQRSLASGKRGFIYLKEFIFNQKCLPWFIIKKWRVFLNVIWERAFYEAVDLEKTYESCFNDEDAFEEILESKHYKYKSALLRNSVYVKFLEKLKDKTKVTDEEIKATEYYQATWKQIQASGGFRGNRNEAELLQQCRYFFDLYRAMKRKAYRWNYRKFVNIGKNHSPRLHPWVFKIQDSDHFMVLDGHHRLACYYVLGKRIVKARIAGIKKNRLQALNYGEIQD